MSSTRNPESMSAAGRPTVAPQEPTSAPLPRTAAGAMGWRAASLAGVQAIFFVRLLVLARLLAPDAFGLLAIATVALGVLMRLSDVGMTQALVQRGDVSDRQYDVAWTIGILRAGFVAAILVAGAPIVASLFGEPRAASIIQALALRPVIDAAGSIRVAVLTRRLHFRELAFLQIPGAVADTILAVGLAHVIGVWALVAGALGGSLTTCALSYRIAPHRPRLDFRLRAAAPLVRYGRWILITGIVALAGRSMTQLVLSRELGATALGVYFLAGRVAFLPADMANSVAGAIAFPIYSRHTADEDAARTFRTFFTLLMLLLLPVYAMVAVLAPSMSALLGERWAGTAPVIQILALACIVGVFGDTLIPFFMGRGRPERALQMEMVQTAVLLLCIVPLAIRYGPTGAATAWLTGNAAAQLFMLCRPSTRAAWLLDSSTLRLVAALGAALAAALAAEAVRTLVPGLAGFVLAGTAGVLVAGACLWWLDQRKQLGLRAILPLPKRRADEIPLSGVAP